MKTIAGAPAVARAASSTEEPESLSAGVVHRLEVEILKGHRKPGDRLDERQLAEQYGVSRTPVREALQRLAAVVGALVRVWFSAVPHAPLTMVPAPLDEPDDPEPLPEPELPPVQLLLPGVPPHSDHPAASKDLLTASVGLGFIV